VGLSPAQRVQQRKRAAIAAAAAAPTQTMANATVYERHLAKLQQDHLRLKNVQSEKAKGLLKAQLLPTYTPYIDGVLSAGQGAQDDVITTLMIWTLDAANYARALDMAEYILAHGMKLPDRFSRTPGTMVAEEIANAALAALKVDEKFDVEILLRTLTLTATHDMPDQVRAKLHLAIGRAVRASNEETNSAALELAKEHLATAIKLHDGCGGKKDLEKTESLLKKHAAPPAAT